MDFSTALRENGKRTYTENGARAKNTSSDALVDMFASSGSLRSRTPVEITRIFALSKNLTIVCYIYPLIYREVLLF